MKFEDFLRNIHSETYTGTDDKMTEDFEKWLGQLSNEKWIAYMEQYDNRNK